MGDLSHINARGQANMVDVSDKAVTTREAVARGFVRANASTLSAIENDTIAKGSVFATARVAAIMASKKTSDLIPLCHGLPLDQIEVEFAVLEDGIAVQARARCSAKTGVEMEALVAVTHACLTLYDMAKAVDKGMQIGDIYLVRKSGGKSGDWRNDDGPQRTWPTEWF